METRKRTIHFLMPFLFFLSLIPNRGWSASAISCHCFRDRAFDPARPGAVDSYLLANAQNSLLANTFDLSKKDIVKKKMAGADGDRLWLVYAFAREAGIHPDKVEQAGDQGTSWSVQLEQNPVHGRFSPQLEAVFRLKEGDSEIAAAVVDLVLKEKMLVPPSEVAKLRSKGADNQEAILAAVLGKIGERSPARLFSQVASGAATWGGLANQFGVVPKTLEDRVRLLLALADNR